MGNTISIILVVGLFFFAWYIIPRWRMRRAVRQVIAVFQYHHATEPKAARTLDELGLKLQAGLVDRLLRGVDYKTHALQGLIKAGVVLKTPDGRYYLQEEKSAQIRFK